RVVLAHARDLTARAGATVEMSAAGSTDPDGHQLSHRWWQYREAGSYSGAVELKNAQRKAAALSVPNDAAKGQTIHVICEVTDSGTPLLTRYQRVVVTVTP
ncbi:MAG: hypothetical protein L0Y72_12690, partial [Gemmataceae bacterium]|nr:hypothetical protein [Gemmataceae bacterium]